MNLKEIQTLIRELYFQKDNQRGLKGTFVWLIEEVGEVANLIKQKHADPEKISEELADIIAWTASIANILKIDLQQAFVNKYPLKCLKCGKNPCECLEP